MIKLITIPQFYNLIDSWTSVITFGTIIISAIVIVCLLHNDMKGSQNV